MATVYRVWAGLLFLAVLAQIGFAGVGAFHAAGKVEDKPAESIGKESFESWFNPHAILGTLLILVGLILLILALAGRRDRWRVSALIFALIIVQMLLAELAFAVPALGWLHPLNAVLIAYLAFRLAHDEWRRPAAAAAPAVASAA